MTRERRTVLLALLAAVGLAAAVLLNRVLATVFFGATLASVLVPLYQWLRRRGVPRWWASGVATASVIVAAVAVFLPVVLVLYNRRTQLLALLDTLPEEVVVEVAEFVYVVDTGEATEAVARWLTRFAIDLVRASPELAAHATVLLFVVFGLLVGRHRVRRALLFPAITEYHDVVHALHQRARDTLFALYVIQAATALATFALALPLFLALGYPAPVTLAVTAGLLQFLPVVGPSLLILLIAGYEASVGAYPRAAIVLFVGLAVVAFLPDAVLRPRLARETAGLPASLYFVGFTGGLLSVGPVGIIAGPLVVALLAETLSLLAGERRPAAAPAAKPSTESPTETPPTEAPTEPSE